MEHDGIEAGPLGGVTSQVAKAILLWIAWENQLQYIAAVASDCNEKAVPLRHSYKHFGHSDAIHAIRCAKNANQ